MSFSVSVCLTNTGTQSLGSTLSIYSNPVTNLIPGTFVRTVPTTSITGANCPYTFLVPDGTQSIRIFDPLTFCYVDIPVSDNNVCITCELGLNNITNNVLGQINVGSLTGTCDGSIDDYTMSWYGPNSTTNLAFTSGQGTLFSGQYQYTQPLTSVNSPVLNPGVYVARINNVSLNGINFSSTGGTGNILSCSLTSCTTNVTVDSYSCLNGDPLTTDGYGHFRDFTYNGTQPPSILTTKLRLEANTQSVVLAFRGYGIYDTIKLTLSGSAYQTPIQLEEITVGSNSGGDIFTPTTWPKSTSTSSLFRKIIDLSTLTIYQNDVIDIKVTPNNSTNETNWQLYFGCSTKPTGTKTCLDTYKDTPYKIKQSTIPLTLTASAAGSCPITYSLNFSVSGCNYNNNSSWINSNLYKFTNTSSSYNNINTSTVNNLLSLPFDSIYDSYYAISAGGIVSQSRTCQSSVGSNYRIEKTSGFLKIYFSNINDLYTFGDSFNSTKTTTTNYNSGTGIYTTNNADIDYYRGIVFYYKTNDICGDGATENQITIPVNSTLASGTTTDLGYSHFITLTLPTQSYNSSACLAGTCGCNSLSSFITSLNNSINTSFTETRTKLLTNPFGYSYYYFRDLQSSRLEDGESGYVYTTYIYGDKTYPASGGTNFNSTLIIPNGVTSWDWTNHFFISSNQYFQYVFYYSVKAKTPLTSLGFEIYGYSISNFDLGTYRKIYDSATGVVPGQESFFV